MTGKSQMIAKLQVHCYPVFTTSLKNKPAFIIVLLYVCVYGNLVSGVVSVVCGAQVLLLPQRSKEHYRRMSMSIYHLSNVMPEQLSVLSEVAT